MAFLRIQSLAVQIVPGPACWRATHCIVRPRSMGSRPPSTARRYVGGVQVRTRTARSEAQPENSCRTLEDRGTSSRRVIGPAGGRQAPGKGAQVQGKGMNCGPELPCSEEVPRGAWAPVFVAYKIRESCNFRCHQLTAGPPSGADP